MPNAIAKYWNQVDEHDFDRIEDAYNQLDGPDFEDWLNENIETMIRFHNRLDY